MPTKSYREDLLKRLANPEYAALYLKASLDETLEDGNMEAFLLALKDVIDAKGEPVQGIASDADISRQHLYRLLNGTGNPTLETLSAVLQAVGIAIDFKPASEPIEVQ
jgi:probable addiction module antidote protein